MKLVAGFEFSEQDDGSVHRAAANIIVSKSRAARGSVCNVLLSRGLPLNDKFRQRLRASARPVALIEVSIRLGHGSSRFCSSMSSARQVALVMALVTDL